MNLTWSFKKAFSFAALSTAILSGSILCSNRPVSAAVVDFFIKFCGNFEHAPGGVLPGSFVKIDTNFQDSEADNFGLKDAKIMTERTDLSPQEVTYTFDDFIEVVPEGTTFINTSAGIRNFLEPVRGWTFENAFGTLYAVFPDTFFPLKNGNEVKNNFITEVRGGIIAKDVDKIKSEEVPEPLTILGSAAAFGIGGLFKKQYSKKQKKATQQA
ncbi:MAG: PEP-CTERM sorting domain-containing protein [Cyanobacteria bacterium P01_D01_bin.116]